LGKTFETGGAGGVHVGNRRLYHCGLCFVKSRPFQRPAQQGLPICGFHHHCGENIGDWQQWLLVDGILEGAGCQVDLDNGLQQVAGLGAADAFRSCPLPFQPAGGDWSLSKLDVVVQLLYSDTSSAPMCDKIQLNFSTNSAATDSVSLFAYDVFISYSDQDATWVRIELFRN
jgi:hypothetical protein